MMQSYEDQFKSLADIGSINRGKSKHRPRNDPSLYGGAYPFIQTGDVKAAHFYLSSFSQTYNERGLAQSKLWQPGTLCITIAANIADTAILKIPACFPDSIIGFLPKKDAADVRFVKYCLDTYKQQMQSISQGTTQDNLSQEKLLGIKFKIPSFQDQQKIAAVLSAYDDLIENNRRRIELLERMAEELYREWFVRFRFPGWHQSEFAKGIPKTWALGSLGDIASFVMGQSPSSEFYNDTGNGLPFHQGVGTYGYRFPKKITYCSSPGRIAKAGDILFSVRAPVGRLNIADSDLIIGRGIAAIKHKEGLNSYLFYLLNSYFSAEDTIGNGSIFNSVGKDELIRFSILKPNVDLAKKFDILARDIDLQVSALLGAIENLANVRRQLLTRLISGKLPIDQLDIQFPPSMREADEARQEVAHA